MKTSHPAAVVSWGGGVLHVSIGGHLSTNLWIKHHQALDHEELCNDAAYGCSARQHLHMRIWYAEPLVVQGWQRHSQSSDPDCLWAHNRESPAGCGDEFKGRQIMNIQWRESAHALEVHSRSAILASE